MRTVFSRWILAVMVYGAGNGCCLGLNNRDVHWMKGSPDLAPHPHVMEQDVDKVLKGTWEVDTMGGEFLER